MAEEPSRFRDQEVRSAPAVAAAPDGGADRPGPSGDGGGRPAAAAAAPLVPPGFGTSPRGGRGRRGGIGSRPGGRGTRQGRGSLPHSAGGRGGPPAGGRGGQPPPPPHGSKVDAKLKPEGRREERRAALFKRQVAAMEVSPTMLLRSDVELRESVLQGGPDVAPPSSYEELPASQHCYWSETLLPDQARLQAPSVAAPGVDHSGALSAALRLHQQPPDAGSVVFDSTLGDFAVPKAVADLIASI